MTARKETSRRCPHKSLDKGAGCGTLEPSHSGSQPWRAVHEVYRSPSPGKEGHEELALQKVRMNIMDIAWRAQALTVGESTIYIARAPLVQQTAAFEVLSSDGVLPLDGCATIVDPHGSEIPMAFLSIRREIFRCFEVEAPGRQAGLRQVLITCGFDGEATARYMRRVAELTRDRKLSEAAEAGFVGALGFEPEQERRFFGTVPREAQPLSDFLATVERIGRSLHAGSLPDLA
jgi:hypothetical protein